MKIKFNQFASLIALLSFNETGSAQKIKDEHAYVTFMHEPKIDLSAKYSTYRIDYDLGDFFGRKPANMPLGKLTYSEDNPDLALKIFVKNPYVSDSKLYSSTSGNHTSYYYKVNYNADYGYSITDLKTKNELAFDQYQGGSVSTESFHSMHDLDMYMHNGFIAKLIPILLNKVKNKVGYIFDENKFTAGFQVNTVSGDSKEYEEINQASADFMKAISENITDKKLLQPSVVIWEKYLAQAHYEDNKSIINEKVADALIENLCGAYLIVENYPKIKEHATVFNKKHGGIFSKNLKFKLSEETLFPGPKGAEQVNMFSKNMKHFYEIDYLSFSEFELRMDGMVAEAEK